MNFIGKTTRNKDPADSFLHYNIIRNGRIYASIDADYLYIMFRYYDDFGAIAPMQTYF
jgi:hypothetical protein